MTAASALISADMLAHPSTPLPPPFHRRLKSKEANSESAAGMLRRRLLSTTQILPGVSAGTGADIGMWLGGAFALITYPSLRYIKLKILGG